MDRKKIFGLSAVVFLILVALAPVINGFQFKTDELDNNYNLKSSGAGNIHCKINRCEFIEYLYNKAIAIYEVEWTVWFDNIYMEGTGECVLKAGGQVFDTWRYHISCMQGGVSGTQRLRLRSSEIPSVDEERDFAGKIARLEVYSGSTLKDSSDVFVKYWKEDQDYIPTNSQVEVSTPNWFNKIYCVPQIPDLYKLEFFDVRILPNILKSERMGWTGQAAKYFIHIGENITEMLGTSVAFLILIKSDLKIITEWLIDFITWFYNAINGNIFGISQIIHDFIQYVLPAVDRILAQATIWGGTILIIGQKLTNVIDEFYQWTLDDPWTKPITIHVIVDNVELDETVTLICRNASGECVDSDNDGRIDFNFKVSSTPMYNEKSQEGIHNCLIIVKGSKHINPVKSIAILSYAFANGSLYWHFPQPGNNRKEKINEKIFFIEGFINFLKNKPLLNFFKKQIEKPKFSKKINQQTSLTTRDFNLSEFMKKVKQEKYESYEGLIYKPYYKGAPYNPKIVYYSSNQVIIGYKSYVDVTQIDKVQGYPIVDRLIEINTVVVEIYGIEPEDFLEIVNKSEDVEYTELNFVYKSCYAPNDPLWDWQWGPKAINCPQAWDKEKGRWDISVAILDTGCNYNHEDISNKYSTVNYDFVNKDNDPMDDCYVKHGTHCAGIIGATIDNHKGISGVAPEAWTDYIKILDSDGTGYSSTIAKGIIHATKYDDQIISMSLGGYGISVCLHAACDYAYYIKNTLIIAAAGNDGQPILCYPARFESVISVGAVDENLNLCSWSNYGPRLDIVAPGENIISTVEENYYEELSGTSMATPHVAGAAALILSAFPNYNAVLCKGRLFSSAIDLGNKGKDIKYGYGLVDAHNAVRNIRSVEINPQIFKFLPRLQFIINNL